MLVNKIISSKTKKLKMYWFHKYLVAIRNAVVCFTLIYISSGLLRFRAIPSHVRQRHMQNLKCHDSSRLPQSHSSVIYPLDAKQTRILSCTHRTPSPPHSVCNPSRAYLSTSDPPSHSRERQLMKLNKKGLYKGTLRQKSLFPR